MIEQSVFLMMTRNNIQSTNNYTMSSDLFLHLHFFMLKTEITIYFRHSYIISVMPSYMIIT